MNIALSVDLVGEDRPGVLTLIIDAEKAMTTLAQIQHRAAKDPLFGNEIRTALSSGGLPAAADVARRHGFDVPTLTHESDELSDLELELVSGGKGLDSGTLLTLGLLGLLF